MLVARARFRQIWALVTAVRTMVDHTTRARLSAHGSARGARQGARRPGRKGRCGTVAWAWAGGRIAHVEFLNRLLVFACLAVYVARSINFPVSIVPSFVDKVLASLAAVHTLRTRARPQSRGRIADRRSCSAVHGPARRRASPSNPLAPCGILGTAVCVAVTCCGWCWARFAAMLRLNRKRLTDSALGAVGSAVGTASIAIGA